MIARTGTAKSGDLDIAYEDFGNEDDPAVLLIMGLGAQLVLWRKDFCEKLVNQGLRVIRFDNRDVGLSSKLPGAHSGAPLIPRMARSLVGVKSPAGYTLEDMADDAAALLDHLGLDRAHVVGGSMGGMIAQVFAARHAARTRSLGVIFSSNNRALLPPPRRRPAALGGAHRVPRRSVPPTSTYGPPARIPVAPSRTSPSWSPAAWCRCARSSARRPRCPSAAVRPRGATRPGPHVRRRRCPRRRAGAR